LFRLPKPWHGLGPLICLLLILAVAGPLRSADPALPFWTSSAYPATFEHLSVEQGLSQSSVYCMIQDRRGFLWFGTDSGLNRFDGLRFLVFHPEKNNPKSLSGDRILRMLEDHRGYIWLATRNGGITILNPDTLEMMPILPTEAPGGLPAQTVACLVEDRQGNVWIGTETMGLCMVANDWKLPARPRFITFNPSVSDPRGAPEWGVTAMHCDRKGTLWIGSRVRGLGRLVANPGNGRLVFDYFAHDPARPEASAPAYIYAIHEDPFGLLWLGGNNGPFTFDLREGRFQRWTRAEGESIDLGNSRVLDILQDSAGTMWLASDGSGLLKVLPRHQPGDPIRFKRFSSDITNSRGLSGNGLQCLLEDRSGVLWVSSYRGGLNKLVLHPGRSQDREKPLVYQYQNSPADPQSLGGNTVATVCEDRFGHLWVGTDGSGLHRAIPPRSPADPIRFERFREDPRHGPGSLQSDVILTSHLDAQRRLWLGTYNAGLVRIDQASASAPPRFTHFRHDPRDPESLASNFVRSILDDGHGGFWIAFDDNGFNHFDPRTGKARRYRWGSGPLESSCGTLLDLEMDTFGTIWIATPVGLNRFHPPTGEFRIYKAGGPGSLSESFINSLYLDGQGILWIGTDGGGLNRMVIPPWEGPAPTFTHFGMAEGLSSDFVNAILPDERGQLWLSTSRQLCRFDPQEGRAHPLPWQNELKKVEFIRNAAYRSAGGELFFGSNDGLTLFRPVSLVYNTSEPSLAIADFQVSNRSLPLGERQRLLASGEAEITIHPGDSVFSFDFVALDFVAPERNQYAYRMEGLDRTWNEIGNKHFVSYTGLPPGQYVLQVKGANCDGVWNRTPLSLRVRVLAPWYKTWWFRSILASCLAAAVYATFRIRIRVLHHRNRLLENVVAARTQELAQANEALRSQSLTDPLTGLHNRRYLYACMPEDIAQVQRQQRGVAANDLERLKQNIDVLFVMVDLDHFKQVNDQYGHHAGDLVLQQMSEVLRGALRDTDTITRWGGEEFLVVARNTARADATVLPERIRSAVEAHPFDIGREHPIHCHCSLGFSIFPFLPRETRHFPWEQIVDIADACLYAAKENGRNAWVGIIPEGGDTDEIARAIQTAGMEQLLSSGLFRVMSSIEAPLRWKHSSG